MFVAGCGGDDALQPLDASVSDASDGGGDSGHDATMGDGSSDAGDAQVDAPPDVMPDSPYDGPPLLDCDGGLEGGAPVSSSFCQLPGKDATEIAVPAGFCVREFTTAPLFEARVMRFAPNGDLFVASPSQSPPGGASGGLGQIVVLPDDNKDGVADSVVAYAGAGLPMQGSCTYETDPANLSCVHGLLFSRDGHLYYSRSTEVRRFPYTTGQRMAPSASGELVATLSANGSNRWTHTIDEALDGTLLVSRGRYDTGACSAQEELNGAIFGLSVSGTLPVAPQLIVQGFRNPMFLRCHAGCGGCFADELSGDGWDGIGGREKLVKIAIGENWGYPCCVDKGMPVPGVDAGCDNVSAETISMPLHDTPFGLDFEPGRWPAPYAFGFFFAFHGSFASWSGTQVAWLPIDPATGKPTGQVQTFATGWGLRADSGVVGRATEVAFAPDGRLFVSDDTSGRIFWIAPR